MRNEMDDYIPERAAGTHYYKFLIDTAQCAVCEKTMVRNMQRHVINPFPVYFRLNFEAQRERAGLGLISGVSDEKGKALCMECAEKGKASFICAMCGAKKPSDKVCESFGAVKVECLCVDCYDTQPARKWDKMVEELREKHQWDWE